ncbi:MAG: hypothetical protein B7Y51_12705, partial [Burkholderiales bacterium 28-67-8]
QSLGDLDAELRDRFAYEPFLVRDRSVNAFALPGGFVGVHLGLMAITQTRDELASVLAHEMTHVNQRHIARGFANSKRQSLITAAAMILGVLAATRSGGADAANAMIMGGQAMGMQGQLNFSRDMEREADRIGMAMMRTAGFQPSGMAAMFERLQQASRLNDYGGFPYLRSHPLTTERIGEARARLGTVGIGSPAALQSSPSTALEHSAALARARVLMDPRADSLRRWQALDGEGSSPAATRGERFADDYSSALASSLLREWSAADASIRKAMILARGTPPLAQPGNTSRPVLLFGAQIALVMGQAGDALAAQQSADQLQTWVAQYPLDAEAWLALFRVRTQLGQGLQALRADAESRYSLGDLPGAIERLRAGRRLAGTASGAGDFVELSVIDSRLRLMEAQRKQQLLDAKNL